MIAENGPPEVSTVVNFRSFGPGQFRVTRMQDQGNGFAILSVEAEQPEGAMAHAMRSHMIAPEAAAYERSLLEQAAKRKEQDRR